MGFVRKTASELSKLIKNKEISSVELTKEYLNHIEKENPKLNAFLEVFDDAVKSAEFADERIRSGDSSSLTGIPIALKDNILVDGKHASAASKILEPYIATYDSTVTKKLKEEGMVIIGRTNMDEFAMGSSTENSAYGVVKNPHDTTRVPGGSSGGSVAAVAGDLVPVSLGSDTGGSVRQPASLCGVVGLRPTYGSVSRHGLIAMASSLDVVGPVGKTVEDVELVYKVISGKDENDSTSCDMSDYDKANRKDNYVIGVPKEVVTEEVDKDVLESFNKSLEELKKKGHEVKEVSLSYLHYALPVYYIIMPAEVSSNLARFDGMRYGLNKKTDSLIGDYIKSRGEGFGPESRRRIILGTYILSAGYYDAYYRKAQLVRSHITKELLELFKGVDVIAMPTSPIPAFKIGEKEDPLSMYLTDVFTTPASLAGIPSISVPIKGVKRDGIELPVGLQLNATHMGEDVLFDLGKQVTGEK